VTTAIAAASFIATAANGLIGAPTVVTSFDLLENVFKKRKNVLKEFFHHNSLHIFMGVNTYMNLSFSEIMTLIQREKEKYQKLAEDTGYSREHSVKVAFHANRALNDLEKKVRRYLAKKYN
tara:strand:+ start:266 stop:628 length:363 start_codon:yes stop_codon:yes gene_type:complete